MAGYSKTPLIKKLGIKVCTKIYIKNSPANYEELVHPLPGDVRIVKRLTGQLDVVHLFTRHKSELEKCLEIYIGKIKQAGMIWVSWPKKSSGVKSDFTEDTIREVALPLGLVDIKVCAVDETWSGLKLVIRKENRK